MDDMKGTAGCNERIPSERGEWKNSLAVAAWETQLHSRVCVCVYVVDN